MTDTLSQFWPQLMAFSVAMGIALAINGAVFALKSLSPNSPSLNRWLPALPAIFGGLMGFWTWPFILDLAFTGYDQLATVKWSEYWAVNVLLGVGQGAVSSNLYKFWSQTIMGRDGALKRALFRFLRIDKHEEDIL